MPLLADDDDRDRLADTLHRLVRELDDRALARMLLSVGAGRSWRNKELVGEFENAGRELRPQGDPVNVNVHDS